MFDRNEIVLPFRDAAALAAVAADWPAREPSEQAAADALADAVAGARLVKDRAQGLPVVTLGATVTYDECPDGARRTVTLVHPSRADASRAQVSVFAPVARTLLGRRAGALVPARLPDRAIRELRVVAVDRAVQEDDGPSAA